MSTIFRRQPDMATYGALMRVKLWVPEQLNTELTATNNVVSPPVETIAEVDTGATMTGAFVLSWVRVRQCAANRRWLALSWNILLALAMSAILFQPIAIHLLQQSLSLDFIQAVDSLGINIVILTYARSAVAVLLGAILAITNVETEMTDQPALNGPKRKVILLERLLNQIAPIVNEETSPAQLRINEETPAQLPALVAQQAVQSLTTPQEREARIGKLDFSRLSNAERVARILTLFPDISDRELGRLCKLSAATAKKHKQAFKRKTQRRAPDE